MYVCRVCGYRGEGSWSGGSLRRGQGRGKKGLGLGKFYRATNQGCSVEKEEEEDDGGGKYRGIFCNRKGKGKKRKEQNRTEKKRQSKTIRRTGKKDRQVAAIRGIGSPAMIAYKIDAKL